MNQQEMDALQAGFIEHFKKKNSTKEGRAETLGVLVYHCYYELLEEAKQNGGKEIPDNIVGLTKYKLREELEELLENVKL